MLIRTVQRWRPYVIVIVTALLITSLPSRHRDGSPQAALEVQAEGSTQIGDGLETGIDAGTGMAAPGDETSVITGAGGSEAGGSAPGGAPRGVATGGEATDADPEPPRVTGAGLNSSAALAAPDCDRARRRMLVSFTRAAPCAVPWPKGADNGGATSQGVTADTINVIIYNPPADPNAPPIGAGSEANLLRGWNNASKPFEHFYRTWGRTVRYSVYNGTGNDEVAQRADAIEMANRKPFAVVQVSAGNTVLMTELAARGVVMIANAGVSQALADKLAPYVWGASVQAAEQIVVNAAHYVAKRLMGRPARWAGQAEYRPVERRFGLLQTSDVDQGLFERQFRALGGSIADKQTYDFGAANTTRWAEQARTLVARMKSKNVTSVIAVADFLFLAVMTKEATNQRWFPEWIVTGLLGSDIDIMATTFDQVQWANAFGAGSLYPGNSMRAPQFHFQAWYWGAGYQDQPRDEAGLGRDETPLLYSGIHGAGPNLTPQTFRDGAFAVAPSGGAAEGGLITMVWSYGRWGYYPLGDDYNGYDDFVEIWWDATSRGRDNLLGQEKVGLYRYVNRGKRYFYNQWPGGEPNMFDRNGIAPYYEDYPTPQERPPDIPCRGCPSEG